MKTLEEVNNDVEDYSESDSDSDSDNGRDKDSEPAWDANGREIAPISKSFFVGKFCMANAKMAHALEHWKYHLNEFVVTWLTKSGYLKSAEIVRRDGLSEKKRRKAANKIADKMEREGVVKELWSEFRANISEARDSKQGRF